MPYKDQDVQRAHNRENAAKRKADPIMHAADLESKRKWARKNKLKNQPQRELFFKPSRLLHAHKPAEILPGSPEYQAWWRKNVRDKNPDMKRRDLNARNQRESTYRKERKRKLIDILGGKCRCCGVSDITFLTVDHVFNDGHEERKSLSAVVLYERIIKGQVDLSRYQCLCWNCNHGKRINGGICPHDVTRAAVLLALCAWNAKSEIVIPV